jgi:hypothetical protein
MGVDGRREAGGRFQGTKKPDYPEASGFLTDEPVIRPDSGLFFEALDVLGNGVLVSAVMMVLGASTEAERNEHEGHESNVFHNIMFLN